jgi:hypothetical protein
MARVRRVDVAAGKARTASWVTRVSAARSGVRCDDVRAVANDGVAEVPADTRTAAHG